MKIKLLGTSHIAPESVTKIAQEMESFQPDIVCVELDRQRLQALLSDAKPQLSLQLIFRVGAFGYLFVVIASLVQRYLAKKIGMKPGIDMLTAVQEAQKRQLSVAVIDQPIQKTLQRLSKKMSFGVICHMLWDLVAGLFSQKAMMKKLQLESFDLRKVPSAKVVQNIIQYMEEQYPVLYEVLIEERNLYMYRKIKTIQQNHPGNILVVVGAGHIPGLQKLLQ